MGGAVVEQVYRYPAGSRFEPGDGGGRLALATSGGAEERLFSAWLPDGATVARALLTVGRTARTRFHLPPAAVAAAIAAADPVVTSAPGVLRFESFSLDCGVYARLDLTGPEIDAGVAAAGTTNVDLGEPMRAALAGVTGAAPLHLGVGLDELTVLTAGGAAVERRVPLPDRWLRAFGEVQVALAAMAPAHALGPIELRRLLRELPRSGPLSTVLGLRPGGGGLRLTRRLGAGAIPLAGPARLRLLEALLGDIRSVQVFAGPTGASAWLARLPGARFTLALSPETWRGFSGEGGALREGDPALRGLAGFDLETGEYFARRLPFDLRGLEALHPRLRGARKLLDEGAVRIVARSREGAEAFVRSGATEYHVRLEGDGARCTCRWHARHQGERGPCKHVLATELAAGRDGPG